MTNEIHPLVRQLKIVDEIKTVRVLDLLQVLFRINSRLDIKVALTPHAKSALEYTITWYNRHVDKLVQLVKTS